jgi:hypothetical protein
VFGVGVYEHFISSDAQSYWQKEPIFSINLEFRRKEVGG